MTIRFRSVTRMAAVLTAATVAIGLFATGVWAGSERSDDRGAVQPRSSFWSYDAQTGNPTGPAGQLDFWNYDPTTGKKISDYSPGVAPEDLPSLWNLEP